jgi:uncharacterized protein involved in exopolysaccharide biosynthesis
MNMEPAFDNRFILNGISKWKKHLLIVALLSAAASAFFSGPMFIKPRFKSQAVLYPVNLVPYGNESPAEQLLQLLQSSEVRNAVMVNLHLDQHYGIPCNPAQPTNLLIREFNDRVSISKTEYESVEINVLDTDPKMAWKVANEIIREMNLFARKIQREKSAELKVMFSEQLRRKNEEMDSLQNKLKDLRVNYGILDFDREVRDVGRAVTKSLGKGVPGALAEKHRNFAEKGGEFQKSIENWRQGQTYFNKVKTMYDDVSADLFKELTYANVVSKPYIASNKSYPVRWLIVLGSVCASLALAIFLLFVFNRKNPA